MIAHVRKPSQKSLAPYQGRTKELLLGWLQGGVAGWGDFEGGSPSGIVSLHVQLPHSGSVHFAALHRAQATSAMVLMATRAVQDFVHASRLGLQPLLIVPFMGESGASICAQSGVNWLDLSGNASVRTPGLVVQVRGNENQFKRSGRPASVFSPRSSRIVRQLLLEPYDIAQRDLIVASSAFEAVEATRMPQRELVTRSEVDEGYASRVIRKMIEDGILMRKEGFLWLPDRLAVLDAWRNEYDFSEHTIVKGHLSSEDGDVLGALVTRLHAEGDDYALTGLAAAAALTDFGNFRLVTAYVREIPDEERLRLLKIRPESRGANVWLVQPKDPAVFWGRTLLATQQFARLPIVHPLQVYLDLKAQPERSDEASAQMRRWLEKYWGAS